MGGGWLMEGEVGETQQYLKTMVRPGDPVMLALSHRSVDGEPTAHFTVSHNGRPVGLTSEEFARSLSLALGRHAQPVWPRRIVGVHAALVDTVAGHPSVGHKYGLGASGLWLRVLLSVLGT